MAMKDEWRSLRLKRQQEVKERQQQVRASLTAFQTKRQAKALELHKELNDFHHTLIKDGEIRIDKAKERVLSRQDFCRSLDWETKKFLVSTGDRRRLQAQQLIQQLEEYVRSLSSQTAQFLSLTGTERSLMAGYLAKELRDFHTQLQLTNAELHKELQQNWVLRRVHLTHDLAIFVEKLRLNVGKYLQELEGQQKERSRQVANNLQQSRDERLAAVQALGDRLAYFHNELQKYHINLHESVEGSPPCVPPLILEEKEPKIEKNSLPVGGSPSPATSLPSNSPTVAHHIPEKTLPVAVLSQPQLKTLKFGSIHEQQVYEYIAQSKGPRLTEIETALTMNRVQTVDALRSLLTKGLIAERDRVYLIHPRVETQP